MDNLYIWKSSWDEVDKVKARYNGEKLDKKYIRELIPVWEDVFSLEAKLYHITYPSNIQPGATVSYSFRRKHQDIALMPIIAVPNLNEIKRFDIIVKHPKQISVDFEAFFPREELPFNLQRVDKEMTRIMCGPIEHFDDLPLYAFNNLHAALILKLTWDGELITPITPTEFYKWYSQIADLRPTLSDSVVNALPLSFVDSRTAEDTLAVLHDFVRNNIRYIAHAAHPHTIVPHEPLSVLRNRYGDCKDRASLISAMARALGLEVDMVLITARPYEDFGAVHAGLFNHVICGYKSNDGPVFFDPTDTHHPFASLRSAYIGKQALILNPDSPRFINVPTPIEKPAFEVQISAHIDSLQNCRARVMLRHDPFAAALQARQDLAGFKLQSALSSITSSHLNHISIDSLSFDTVGYDEMLLTGKADLSDFIVGTGENRYVPQTPFSTSGNDILDREDDPWAIHLDGRAFTALTIDLTAPGAVAVPDSVETELNQIAHFTAYARNLDADRVRFEYFINRPVRQISAENKDAFVNMCREYMKRKTDMFVLKKESK